jgi:hypothetical protein
MHPGTPTAKTGHRVQLFDSSKSLADTIAEFLIAGFGRGEPLLMVVTPPHRELLCERLERAGLNVRNAAIANRLTILDAAATLDKFMRQDRPHHAAFDEVVGSLIARLAGGKRVCIYGEMVDVLAARGNYRAACELEILWNNLGRRESFNLFCGYASGHFGDPRTAAFLAAICAAHDRLHRKPDDLLAEFLLDQAGVRGPARGPSSPS